jgi:hypothetical protein
VVIISVKEAFAFGEVPREFDNPPNLGLTLTRVCAAMCGNLKLDTNIQYQQTLV